MQTTRPKTISRCRKQHDWRAEGKRLGARLQEIRKEHRIKTRVQMAKLMQERVGPQRALNRDRIRRIEETGNLSVIELMAIAETLNCPFVEFLKPPYGETPIPIQLNP